MVSPLTVLLLPTAALLALVGLVGLCDGSRVHCNVNTLDSFETLPGC
eukprot:COSAG02_NODE_245_length_27293_cov_16.488012_9_plen_47_part_00